MRIRINILLTLLVLFTLNIVLLGLIFWLGYRTELVAVKDIGINNSRVSILPFLKQDIEAININSRAFVIYEPNSRSIVSGKNENFRFSPASSAKIMTAIIVLEEYPLNKILVSNGVDTVVGSKMKLSEGELITVENLLYGLMLPSGNDAAYVLAENYPGGSAAFVLRMNEKAKELQLLNTEFHDPSGLEDENFSTAHDLARLASYAMENQNFRKIVSTKEITVHDISEQIEHELTNLNELLELDDVVGVKTGFTEEAGGVLVTAVNSKRHTYIIVVLNTPERFEDTKELIFDAIKNIDLVIY